MPDLRRAVVAALAALTVTAVSPAASPAAGLLAGAGRADITPRTGTYLGGWTRADRVGNGQHTRLFASALVLERDGHKVALVAMDLFGVPAGMVQAAAQRAGAGFSASNVLVTASHTHAGPGGFSPFSIFNTAAPSVETIGRPETFVELLVPKPADGRLYTFLVGQLATAIRRADADRAPAAAAWGSAEIFGVTRNRSLEAHLADHGILLPRGSGTPEMDPDGAVHTIDPAVDVLRVDKVGRRRGRPTRTPIGAFSVFANHGTVNPGEFQVYNRDHHGAAISVFEDAVRRTGRVPRSQPVVNVYGNGNEGDMSAALVHRGPAYAERVGRIEAAAMLRAWRAAGRRLARAPRLDSRWTRVCFCGQEVDGARVADSPVIGLPFLTGSEEGRGSLYDITHVPFEDMRSPVVADPAHGHKIPVPAASPQNVPKAVPIMVVRIGDHLVATMPGEPTIEVGRRARQAVIAATAGAGITRVVISGLANDFLVYFTTPEEYDRQHYEGGNNFYGRMEGALLIRELGVLAGRLARGEPAQPAYAMDPTNGVQADAPPYGDGAQRGALTAQPAGAVTRLERARMAWRGGRDGLDRPVDRSFVSVERLRRGRWREVTSDLGLQIVWTIAGDRYEAKWEVPLTQPAGTYRFVVSAKRYRLESRPFVVTPTRALTLHRVDAPAGRVAVALGYPPARELVDFTDRPDVVRGGAVQFCIGARTVRVTRGRTGVFSVAAGSGVPVAVAPGGARDRYGNVAGAGHGQYKLCP